MSTVMITNPDGSTYETQVEHCTREQMFVLLREGQVSFDDFNDWVGEQRHDAYCDGAAAQSELMSY